MPKLILVDDDKDRCDALRSVLDDPKNTELSKFFGEINFLHCDNEGKYGIAVNGLTKIDEDVIVLLDLGFRKTGLIWKSVVDNLKSLVELVPGLSLLDDNGKKSIALTTEDGSISMVDETLDGLSVIALTLRPKCKILVIVVTDRGKIGGLQSIVTASQAAAYKKGFCNFRLETEKLGREPGKAPMGVLKSAMQRWRDNFPDFHDEPEVNAIVTGWMSRYDYLASNGSSHFCSHGKPAVVGSIEGSPQVYRNLIVSTFGVNQQIADRATDSDLKAIFQLDAGPINFAPGSTFLVSDTSFGYGEKTLSTELMSAILEKISGAIVSYTGETEMSPPCQPVFPFLLSLVVLFIRMKNQDEGMLNSKKPILLHGAKNGPNRLSIPLRPRENFRGKIGACWERKLKQFKEQIQPEPHKKGGVCPALWDVLNAQVRGIRSDGQTDETKKKLLRLFDGPSRLIAGCSFGPYYIHIHW